MGMCIDFNILDSYSKSMKSGQALIVVLLILGVVTTVALSIASRSVSEVAVSTTQQESAQALAAAEAGVRTVHAAWAEIPLLTHGLAGNKAWPE